MRKERLFNAIKTCVNFTSLEFLLTKLKWPNGGTVIFIRALAISTQLIIVYGCVMQGLDPTRTSEFSLIELQLQIINSLGVYGAIFAAIYVALYSRFSSQWSYLSNLYNQIKQTEATLDVEKKVLSHWKAGFIEDAYELHLSSKPMFAAIIKSWVTEPDIKKAFIADVPDREAQLQNIVHDIKTRQLLK